MSEQAGAQIIVASCGNKLITLEASTGKKLWEFQAGKEVFSAPVIATGTVFVGSYDGKVYALEEGSGKKLWEFETGSVHSSPAVAEDIVIVSSRKGKVYSLEAATGKKLWEFQAGKEVYSSPAVAGDEVFIGSYEGKVYALEKGTGKKLWEFQAGGFVESSPAIAGERLFIGSNDGKLYALLMRTGEKLWEFHARGPVSSSPAVAGDRVFIGSVNRKVYALEAATGKKLWEFPTGGMVISSPAVTWGTVFIGSVDRKVYALEAATGKKLWEFPTGGPVFSSPSVAGNMVFIGSADEKLYALEAGTGKKLWEFVTSAQWSSPTVIWGPEALEWPMFRGNPQRTGSGTISEVVLQAQALKEKAEKWHKQGFSVPLEEIRAMKPGRPLVKVAQELEDQIARLQQAAQQLQTLDTAEFREEAGALTALLKDPSQAEEAELHLKSLKELIDRGEGKRRQAQRLLDEGVSLEQQGLALLREERFTEAGKTMQAARGNLALARQALEVSGDPLLWTITSHEQSAFTGLLLARLGEESSGVKEAISLSQQGNFDQAEALFQKARGAIEDLDKEAVPAGLKEVEEEAKRRLAELDQYLKQCLKGRETQRDAADQLLKTAALALRQAREHGCEAGVAPRFFGEATVAFDRGHYADAAEKAEKAREAAEEVHRGMAEEAVSQAQAALEEAAKLDPGPAAWFAPLLDKARSCLEEGDFIQALKEANELKEEVRKRLEALSLLQEAEELANRRAYEEALQKFASAREALGDRDPHLRETIASRERAALAGLLLAHLGEAISRAQEGVSLSQQDRFDQAEPVFQQARAEVEKLEEEARLQGLTEVQGEAKRRAAELDSHLEECHAGRKAQKATAAELIASARSALEKAGNDDCNVSQADGLLSEAESAFAAGRYLQTIEGARQAKEIAEAIHSQTAEEAIAVAELTLEEGKHLEPGLAPKYEAGIAEAKSWLEKGDFSQALKQATQINDELEEIIAVITRFREGEELFERQEYAEALKRYDSIIEIDSTHKEAWRRKGEALKFLGESNEAIKQFEKVIEIDPQDKGAWIAKGHVLRELERYNEAIECFDELLKRAPGFAGAWLQKAMALRELGKHEDALKHVEKALELEPMDAQAWFEKGETLAGIEKHGEAIKSYEKALEIDPDFRLAREGREKAQQTREAERQGAEKSLNSSRAALEKAQAFGCPIPEEIEEQLIEARAALEREDFNQAWLLAAEAEEKIKKLKEQARPRVTIKLFKTGFAPDTWDDVEIGVSNPGNAHAQAITLSFPKRVEVEKLEEIPLLRAGEETRITPSLKPLEKGKVPVNIRVDFRDPEGKEYSSTHIADIFVGMAPSLTPSPPTPSPPTPPTPTPPTPAPATLTPPTAQASPYPWQDIYEIGQHIRSGGFAAVYRARRKQDRMTVALKLPLKVAEADSLSPKSIEELQRDFHREADLWKMLRHDHIVQLLDFGDQPYPWLAMEFMAGGTLHERLGKYSLRQALEIFLPICSALEHAHSVGVVHRDIKPANILFTEKNVPKLSDWGLARHRLFGSYSRDSSGTFFYFSPEQRQPERYGTYGHAGDVFQLGIVLYQTLTGQHPFLLPEESELDVGFFTVPDRIADPGFEVPAPSTQRPEVPSALDEVVSQCLHREQKKRYREVYLLREALEEVIKGL